jgi:hypothetical protein
MIKEQPRKSSLYVHLDSLLFDLKYDPTVIELPVPRYFKENDPIELDLIFKEKVRRDGDKVKKEKKKKKKGKKKKKKKDDDDEDKEPPKDEIDKKEKWIDDETGKSFGTKDPVEEIIADPFSDEMGDVISAIRTIQKNERGRQGRARY